jgi:hypothetical protein
LDKSHVLWNFRLRVDVKNVDTNKLGLGVQLHEFAEGIKTSGISVELRGNIGNNSAYASCE